MRGCRIDLPHAFGPSPATPVSCENRVTSAANSSCKELLQSDWHLSGFMRMLVCGSWKILLGSRLRVSESPLAQDEAGGHTTQEQRERGRFRSGRQLSGERQRHCL